MMLDRIRDFTRPAKKAGPCTWVWSAYWLRTVERKGTPVKAIELVLAMMVLVVACGAAVAAPSPAPMAPGCADASDCGSGPPVVLSPAEKKAVDWLVARIREKGSVEQALGPMKPRDFLKSGGHDPAAMDLEKVKVGVDQALRAGGSELSVTRCATYGACAIGTDLTEATGPLLQKYAQQKREDGLVFKDRQAPAFRLKDLEGRTRSLDDYRGKRVALVFWQSHCSHSMKSLPLWDKLQKELGGKRFEVVTVLFNGGDAPYVKTWYGPMGHKLPVLLADSEALAESYGSHLVPSVFLIDERGRLVKKLVTQQTEDTLRRELKTFARRA